jgi:hypothetical protein
MPQQSPVTGRQVTLYVCIPCHFALNRAILTGFTWTYVRRILVYAMGVD